jgi:hypothetical protein
LSTVTAAQPLHIVTSLSPDYHRLLLEKVEKAKQSYTYVDPFILFIEKKRKRAEKCTYLCKHNY